MNTPTSEDRDIESCRWVADTRKRLKAWKEEWDPIPKPLRKGELPRIEPMDFATLGEMPDRPKTVRVDPEGEYIDLAAYPAAPYSIELERIDKADKLVRWLHHLTGKTWFDYHMMRDLIETWAERFQGGEMWIHRGL